MKETSLIQLLKSLTPEELQKLDKFLRSAYFTEGRNLSSRITYRYFETLRKYHPHIASPFFNKGRNFKVFYKIL